MAEAAYTIEDCLEMLLGYDDRCGLDFTIDPNDATVFHSMAKQIIKNTPLTDKQYDLLVKKMLADYYVTQFAKGGLLPHSYRKCLSTTRHPLRELDRSKYLKLVEYPPETRTHKRRDTMASHVPWIEVGFPFSKKSIVSVDAVARNPNNHVDDNYVHINGDREHYFKCDEETVYRLINEFKDKDFDIDESLLEFYKKLQHLNNHREKYLTTVCEGSLENFHPETEKYLLDRIGTPSVNNVLKYLDKSILFDIKCIDISMRKRALEQAQTLTAKIVHRQSPMALIKPDEWHIDEVVASLTELDRFPLLVIVSPETALIDLKQVHAAVKDKVDAKEISVLFRLDNDTNAKFNDYVKHESLNSPVTEHTQVVVISKDKLPKPLLKAGWYPESVIRMGSTRMQAKIDQWIYNCDLVIHYDTVATQWQPSHVKRRTVDTI